MNKSKTKGDLLERKSKEYLEREGYYVFLGQASGGFDCIAVIPTPDIKVVEVTTPSNKSRAIKKLMTLPRQFTREVHLWKPREKEPIRIQV